MRQPRSILLQMSTASTEKDDDEPSKGSSSSINGSVSEGGLSWEAILYLCLLAFQFGFQPSLVQTFTPRTICKSSYVLMQEVLKTCMAASILFGSVSLKERKEALQGWTLWQSCLVAGVPAGLYCIQNVAALTAYQNLAPLTFNVLNQTKTLSAALCTYLVMRKKQSKPQMVSLVLLLMAALVMEGLITTSSLTTLFSFHGLSSLWTSASNLVLGGAGAGGVALSRHVTHGVLPVLLASFLSGLAGALSQRNLQVGSKRSKRPKRNVYLFNMELSVASILVLVTSLLWSPDGTRILKQGLFDGWTLGTWIPICTNAAGGIVVGLVTKHAGSVRKGFALIFGIFLSGLVQAASAGSTVSPHQLAGGLLAATSLYLHTKYPYQPKPKSTTNNE